jgi:hypothetical protein
MSELDFCVLPLDGWTDRRLIWSTGPAVQRNAILFLLQGPLPAGNVTVLVMPLRPWGLVTA